MKYRLFIIIAALLLPLVAIGIFVGQAIPTPEKNSADNVVPKPERREQVKRPEADTPRELVLPKTKEQAIALAEKRLFELQPMTQGEWNIERQRIMYRNPPRRIEQAIAITQKHIVDLKAMDERQWEFERVRIYEQERDQRNAQAQNADKSVSDAEKFRNDVEAAFKRAAERN